MNNTIITNIATVTGITAALLIALNIDMFVFAYIMFAISSVLWAIFAFRTSNKQLLIMNVVFSSINMIGIVRFS